MSGDDDFSTTRNRFEAKLKEKNLAAYRLFISEKKKALDKGEDPIRAFREVVQKEKGNEAAIRYWMQVVGNRMIEPEEEDVEFLRSILATHNVTLDDISELLGGDRRKIADVICALKLDELQGVGPSSVYAVVDKLVSGKGTGPKVAPGRVIVDEIPEGLIAKNPDAIELLIEYSIQGSEWDHQQDFDGAQEALAKKISECQEPARKMVLKKIHAFYEELNSFEIPGIVQEIIDDKTGKPAIDKETGKPARFPAVHQKIGAMFIADKKRALIADEMGIGKTAQAIIAKNIIDEREGRQTTAVVLVPKDTDLTHWKKQIAKWNKEGKKVVTIRSHNKEEALKQIEDEKPDFVLVTYDMIFRESSGAGSVSDRLKGVCDYLILDEVHNTKNPDSLRSAHTQELSKVSSYVAMLSGTPVPNRIEDLGVIASILRKHEFTPEEFNRRYKHNTRLVREHIVPNMLRRRKKNTFGEGKCAKHIVNIPMTIGQEREHRRLELNEDGLNSLALLAQLRRCAIDPTLVGVPGRSPKYEMLAELLVDHYDGSPAVVFSSELKEGVLEEICSMLESFGFRVARVDGDPERSGARRGKILDGFVDGEYDVLVATLKTLGEGVDRLTVSHRAYFLDVPFTEAKLAQGITRLDRKGQESPVDIYMLISENSIDELLLRLIEQKKVLAEYLIDGFELTDYERRILFEKSEKLVECGTDPLRTLYRFFGATTNRTTESVISLLNDPHLANFVAEKYWENFDGSFYGNTLNLISEVVTNLEKKGKKFDSVLDVASGPCCLARALGRPVVSLDANSFALAVGKKMLGEKAGQAVCASFTRLPFAKERFDLLVFSLGLLHSAEEEREGILRELNRVMKKDGVAIITTPSGDGRYEKLAKVLPMLGFKVLTDITGTAQSSEEKTFECMIIGVVKVSEPIVDHVPVDLLKFTKDKAESEHWEVPVSRKIKRNECHEFEIDSTPVEEAASSAADSISAVSSQETSIEAPEDAVPAQEPEEAPEPIAKPAQEGQEVPSVPVEILPEKNAHADLTRPLSYLREQYGTLIKAARLCTQEELDSLGVEIYWVKTGGKCRGYYSIREKHSVIQQMMADHKEFASRVKFQRNIGNAPEKVARK